LTSALASTGTEPYTDAQFESVARLVVAAHAAIEIGDDAQAAARLNVKWTTPPGDAAVSIA